MWLTPPTHTTFGGRIVTLTSRIVTVAIQVEFWRETGRGQVKGAVESQQLRRWFANFGGLQTSVVCTLHFSEPQDQERCPPSFWERSWGGTGATPAPPALVFKHSSCGVLDFFFFFCIVGLDVHKVSSVKKRFHCKKNVWKPLI